MVSDLCKKLPRGPECWSRQARVLYILQPLAQPELSVFQCQLLPRDSRVLSEESCFSDTLRIHLPTLPCSFSW